MRAHCRPFKRPRLTLAGDLTATSHQARIVRSRLDNSLNTDATPQGAQTAAAAPSNGGSSPKQPRGLPAQPNGVHTNHAGSTANSKDGQGVSVQVDGANGEHDTHMQGTSLPPANGFAHTVDSPAGALGESQQSGCGGVHHEAQAPADTQLPNGEDCSNGKTVAEDDSAAAVNAHAKDDRDCHSRSTTQTKDSDPGPKRMSWMEPDAANGHTDGHPDGHAIGPPTGPSDGHAYGHITEQLNGTRTSAEDANDEGDVCEVLTVSAIAAALFLLQPVCWCYLCKPTAHCLHLARC